MLTGRESLIRLVGKRRRFLPNRQSLLSTPIQSSLNLCKDSNVGTMTVKTEGSSEQDLSGSKSVVDQISAPPYWVDCPVCGNTVRGEDYMINSHLDTCLARGTKRKLRQHTLLQLNFCEQSKVKTHFCESDYEGTDVGQRVADNNFVCDTTHKLHDFVGAEENHSRECKSLFDSESVLCNDGSSNVINNDRIDCRVDSATLLPQNEMSKYELAETVDDISGVVLKTFIVGRRFSEKIELNPGASITLLRDPDNVKDCNAIKVLSADSGCKVLGFLPRELAQYLSPLMDKYSLSFEGCIISVPKLSLDVVPIQIMCQNEIAFGEQECDDLQVVKSLWKNAFCVAESAKAHPLCKAKYQQNFSVLIQEVLRIYPHLLSYDEKIFLENFTSLSNDSQRLFIRLYTRKGPWFRMSNISYPEIFSCDKGVQELSATGYICSVGSASELLYNDLKDILDILSVSELREILCILKKRFPPPAAVEPSHQKCSFGTRKQDFIASLLLSYSDGSCPLLPNFVLEKTGTCIRISSSAESLIWRAERLFFLNGDQDLSAFLLVDLGIVKYATYNCIISDQIFSSCNDWLAYEEAIEVAQIMDQSLDESNTELVLRCIEISESRISNSSPKATQSSTSELLATFFSCFSASWVYSKVVLLGVSFL